MEQLMYKALKAKAEAEKAEALATLSVYFKNPAGIGEHPQIVEEAFKQLEKLASANDKLENLEAFWKEAYLKMTTPKDHLG